MCRTMGIYRLPTSAYHAMGSGNTERVNHMIARTLSTMVNERQDY